MIIMTGTKISPPEAIRMLEERLDAITEMGKRGCDGGYYELLAWCSKTWSTVDAIFEAGDYRSEEIRQIGVPACSCAKPGGTPMQMEVYSAQLQKYIDQIRADIQAAE
ncbi:MAG: hypothetical protein CVV32_07400 [Methanomicrobiales archaeon HGW-Methanomicrobiales-3]|jgi:hypothetical protein|nr:MAG: hypothetical protein CVV32_07400 [Methanomicrobiales archaeon HGW-Methanomicrobiales-3]